MRCCLKTLGVRAVRGEEEWVARVGLTEIPWQDFAVLKEGVKWIGVTETFKDVMRTFPNALGDTPAGFRRELILEADGVLRVDLIRDIAYDRNGIKRPTNLLYSADSANPYEIAPVKDLIANLTCNPGIIYDLFINNPKANVGGQFKTRDEVMAEIGRILGPGCDISVEINDPFGKSDAEILEEAAKFKEMLSAYRVVIKVPHTGPVNRENVNELLSGDKLFSRRYDEVATEDAFRGHRLALLLHEHGYKVNFTLMFEPYQTALALQAKPYFINSFVRHRLLQSQTMRRQLALYEVTKDQAQLEALRKFMIDKDYLAKGEDKIDLLDVKAEAERLLCYRNVDNEEGGDGLDAVRQSLRWLRQTNLKDTRLIICSMEGPCNYPDIDRLLASDAYADMAGRVVITAEPGYLARFTSANQVVSYQRRFMNAAKGMQ